MRQPGEELEQGRFAGSVATDQRGALARVNGDIQPAKSGVPPKPSVTSESVKIGGAAMTADLDCAGNRVNSAFTDAAEPLASHGPDRHRVFRMDRAASSPLNPALAATFSPPVMEARRWIAECDFPADRPLINLSQAAPVAPPPEPIRAEIARAALEEPDAHIYGPVLGDPELRAEIAAQWSATYGGDIAPEDVAVTVGCNQAFVAALATLAGPGDAVILPTPWYFNHRMWLEMAGVEARLLPCGEDCLPDVEAAAALWDERVKAIILVTPNNPTGAEYPPDLIANFYDLAESSGISLILDETYRDFRQSTDAPHDVFKNTDWKNTLIHLYSFSKVYRLTGHRIGALITDPARLSQAEKLLDTVTICPPRLGQRAALFGLRNMGDWVASERLEILRRGEVLRALYAERLPDWRLLSSGAYFAFIEPPSDLPSDILAERLVAEQSLLALPGTMFGPRRKDGGSGLAERTIRLAFANADDEGLAEAVRRLADFKP